MRGKLTSPTPNPAGDGTSGLTSYPRRRSKVSEAACLRPQRSAPARTRTRAVRPRVQRSDHWTTHALPILPICNLSCECIHDSLDLQPCRDGIRSTFCCYTPFEANDLVPKSQNYSTVIWIASCSLMVITPFSFMVRDSLGKCFYTDEHIPWVPFWTYLLLINYIMPLAIISCAKDMVPRNSWPT